MRWTYIPACGCVSCVAVSGWSCASLLAPIVIKTKQKHKHKGLNISPLINKLNYTHDLDTNLSPQSKS